MEKKTVQITFHCTEAVKRQLTLLAESENIMLSQYALAIAEKHISNKASEYTLLQEVFGSNNSDNSDSSVEL